MNVLSLFKSISTFVFDIDGVLTDGTVLLLENGLQARQMHVKDGLALQMALKKSYRVIVLSGAYSDPVLHRLQYLGIKEIYLALKDKKGFIDKYILDNNIKKEEVLFMGDDLPDVPLLQSVGLACCPADAVTEVKKVSHYISPVNGGKGCVREVIEKVLKLHDKWTFEAEVTSR